MRSGKGKRNLYKRHLKEPKRQTTFHSIMHEFIEGSCPWWAARANQSLIPLPLTNTPTRATLVVGPRRVRSSVGVDPRLTTNWTRNDVHALLFVGYRIFAAGRFCNFVVVTGLFGKDQYVYGALLSTSSGTACVGPSPIRGGPWRGAHFGSQVEVSTDPLNNSPPMLRSIEEFWASKHKGSLYLCFWNK